METVKPFLLHQHFLLQLSPCHQCDHLQPQQGDVFCPDLSFVKVGSFEYLPMSIILHGAGVYHHYHSCQDIQEEQEFKQGTGWVRVNIEVNFVLIIRIESLILFV